MILIFLKKKTDNEDMIRARRAAGQAGPGSVIPLISIFVLLYFFIYFYFYFIKGVNKVFWNFQKQRWNIFFFIMIFYLSLIFLIFLLKKQTYNGSHMWMEQWVRKKIESSTANNLINNEEDPQVDIHRLSMYYKRKLNKTDDEASSVVFFFFLFDLLLLLLLSDICVSNLLGVFQTGLWD